jgi:hypothetical protein
VIAWQDKKSMLRENRSMLFYFTLQAAGSGAQ